MKKITNKKIAKTIGWIEIDSKSSLWRMTNGRGCRHILPCFLTDLNAIVTEIENGGNDCIVFVRMWIREHSRSFEDVWNPKMLCQAMMDYSNKK